MYDHIRPGVVVKLPGSFDRGIVVQTRIKTSRKIVQMAKRFAPDIQAAMDYSAHRLVAEVQTDNGLWTVPVQSLVVLDTSPDPLALQEASKKAQAIKQAPIERKERLLNEAYDAGFHNVNPGAAIEVKFSDIGWAPAVFVKVNSGGRITYSRNGRERHIGSKFVRIKNV